MIKKVNLHTALDAISEHWSPKIVASLNGQQVKIAKVKGEFVWHNHQNEDEFFYVISGQLFIELKDQTICLNPGESVVIPKTIEHRPYAPEETAILLFEPTETINTGEVRNELTLLKLDSVIKQR